MSLIQSHRLRRPPLQRNPPNDTQSGDGWSDNWVWFRKYCRLKSPHEKPLASRVFRTTALHSCQLLRRSAPFIILYLRTELIVHVVRHSRHRWATTFTTRIHDVNRLLKCFKTPVDTVHKTFPTNVLLC